MLSYGLDSDESSERIGDLYSSDLIYHDDKSLEENGKTHNLAIVTTKYVSCRWIWLLVQRNIL